MDKDLLLAQVALLFVGAFVSGWQLRGRGALLARIGRALIPAAMAILQVGGIVEWSRLGRWALLSVAGAMVLAAGCIWVWQETHKAAPVA
jgi:hypothetical protein